jgi:hypothetical protein
MKKVIIALAPLIDLILIPFLLPSAILMRLIRNLGVHRLPLSKKILLSIGVFPIRNHYYEPLFDFRHLTKPLSEDRHLPGLNLNIEEQYSIIESFSFNDELKSLPINKVSELDFYYNNGTFESVDADYWYNIIRLKKPKRIIEIGSGNSTLMAINAVKKNKEENNSYECTHICIEPYEMPWLAKTNVVLMREKVENISLDIFSGLQGNDILFIDSSHVIRPQGDVLWEYLHILPILSKGVIVHIHDIFTPKNYPEQWLIKEVRFWNEQYLLEAFLNSNSDWKIIGALNYLHHNHYSRLASKTPHIFKEFEPGSFYIQKIN